MRRRELLLATREPRMDATSRKPALDDRHVTGPHVRPRPESTPLRAPVRLRMPNVEQEANRPASETPAAPAATTQTAAAPAMPRRAWLGGAIGLASMLAMGWMMMKGGGAPPASSPSETKAARPGNREAAERKKKKAEGEAKFVVPDQPFQRDAGAAGPPTTVTNPGPAASPRAEIGAPSAAEAPQHPLGPGPDLLPAGAPAVNQGAFAPPPPPGSGLQAPPNARLQGTIEPHPATPATIGSKGDPRNVRF